MRTYKNQLPICTACEGERHSLIEQNNAQKRTPAIFLQLTRPVKAENPQVKEKTVIKSIAPAS
jgi:hypothetical protein